MSNFAGNVLSQAKEGMNIYDSQHDLIGRVAEVFLAGSDQYDTSTVVVPVGGIQSEATGSGTGTVGGTGTHRDFENEFSEDVRALLLRQGYIKAEGAAVFGPVWYITPDQIASIDGNQVNLNVAGSDVIRSR